MWALLIYFAYAQQPLQQIFKGQIPNTNYQIMLELPAGWDDPGFFTRLTITDGVKTAVALKDLQGTSLEDVKSFPAATLNLGKHVRIFPASKDAKDRFLILSNWVGGSDWDQLILLHVSEQGKISRVFQKSMLATTIKDYDGDGFFDLLEEGGKGEPTSDNNFSYDPYLVYQQVNKGKLREFRINEKLSRKWSEENRYYWHGSKYNEKLRVDKSGEPIR
jgi:hypothetical protein